MRRGATGPRALGQPAMAGAVSASPGGSRAVGAQAAARRAPAQPVGLAAGTVARCSERSSRTIWQVIAERRRINLEH